MRYNDPFLPQTGIFNPFAPVENQEQFDGSRAVYRRDWAYLKQRAIAGVWRAVEIDGTC